MLRGCSVSVVCTFCKVLRSVRIFGLADFLQNWQECLESNSLLCSSNIHYMANLTVKLAPLRCERPTELSSRRASANQLKTVMCLCTDIDTVHRLRVQLRTASYDVSTYTWSASITKLADFRFGGVLTQSSQDFAHLSGVDAAVGLGVEQGKRLL